MDPELKRQLDEIRLLVKDNHDMLHAMRRSYWLGFFGKVIFWLVLILSPLYLYQQYIQPFIARYYSPTSAASSTPGPFGLPTFAQVQKLLNSLVPGK